MKEKFGEETFKNLLNDKIDSLKGSPPVWMFTVDTINSDDSYKTKNEILFLKSPVILHQLYNEIGEENFYGLINEMINNDVTSTKIFLQILERREGKTTTNWFEQILKNF